MNQKLKSILFMFLPSFILYVIYELGGILWMLLFSGLYSVMNYLQGKKNKASISHTQAIGFVVMIWSVIAIIFTDNEKLYYIPALAGNVLVLLGIMYLTLKRKSIVCYINEDFRFEGLNRIEDNEIMIINILWGSYFVIKILFKIVGMLFLEFEKLYWGAFLLGDPATIVMLMISYYIIQKKTKL